MWRRSPSNWTPLDSVDPGWAPEVEIVDAGGDRLGIVLSAWRGGQCTAARAIVFDDVLAHFAMQEAAYGELSPDAATEEDFNVFVADLSPDLAAVQTVSQATGVLRQYLIPGINMCVEALASSSPTITKHRSHDEARRAAMGDRG